MKKRKEKKTVALGKNKSNSECNSHNGSLLEVDEKVIWGYFSSKITITIQAKLSYMGLFFIKNLSTIWIQVRTQIYVLYTS